MYSILQHGGKQYKVNKGQIICLEKINIKVGNVILFNNIIMFSNSSKFLIGTPFINSIKILGKIISHFRGDKLIILKFRRRKHFQKYQGHRQYFTNVKILDIKN